MNDDASIADFGEWDIENLRLSIFHPGGSVGTGLWRQLMEEPPENSSVMERQGITQEQGIVDGNVLLLVIQNGRLDWHLLPGPTTGTIRESPPTLTVAGPKISLLRRALDVSVPVCGLVSRLALGAVLTRVAKNHSEGLEQLSKYLPCLEFGDQEFSDFVFQINRRRPSPSAPHVRVNRLSRWQLEEVQGGTFAVGSSVLPNFELSQPIFMSRLTLDINTLQDGSAFSNERMPGLFDDLVEFVYEISTKGDIP